MPARRHWPSGPQGSSTTRSRARPLRRRRCCSPRGCGRCSPPRRRTRPSTPARSRWPSASPSASLRGGHGGPTSVRSTSSSPHRRCSRSACCSPCSTRWWVRRGSCSSASPCRSRTRAIAAFSDVARAPAQRGRARGLPAGRGAGGWPHLLVQVVRYESPAVELHTWYHALTADARDVLEQGLATIRGLEFRRQDRMHARAMLARREALACVVLNDGEAIVAHGGGTLHERNELLNALVHLYQDRLPYTRVTSDSLTHARREHPEVQALVIFPRFDPAEVIDLASAGEYLPAGVTRHLIRWRALRVNVPVALCADTAKSLDEKNAWVETWTSERLMKSQVRFYEEPTVLYDE